MKRFSVKQALLWTFLGLFLTLSIHPIGNLENVAEASGGTWKSNPDMPTERHALGAAYSGGKVYAIGGLIVGQPELNINEAFNTDYGTWETLAPMPTARTALAVVAEGGKVYAIGGNDSIGWNVLEAFDTNNGTWESLALMPTLRQGLGAAVVNGKIYAIGGSNKSGARLGTVEEYSPSSNTWNTNKTPMPTPRHAPAVVKGCDDRIYVFGGTPSGSVAPLDVVEAYNPTADDPSVPSNDPWESLAPMPTPRSNLAAALGPNCKIYVIGGFNHNIVDGNFDVVEVYDPGTNTWENGPSMSTARGYLAATRDDCSGKLYAIGGATLPGFSALKTVEVLSFVDDEESDVNADAPEECADNDDDDDDDADET